jgi:hypothetical protein
MPGLRTTPDESGLKPPSGGAVHSPGIYARAEEWRIRVVGTLLRHPLRSRSLAQQAIVELRRIPELTARERRLEILKEVKKRIETEPSPTLFRAPEDLIREDRER